MAIALCACTRDVETTRDNSAVRVNDDGTISLTMALMFPDLQHVGTRAMGATADLQNLDLFIALFSGGNISQKIAVPSLEKSQGLTENCTTRVEGNIVYFTVKLDQSGMPVVAHLIALNDSDGSFANVFAELNGPESVAMYSDNLCTADGQDAYWQRVELGQILVDNKEEIAAKLHHSVVHMLRNFAAVSVDGSNVNTFTLKGFEVINTWKRGYIVPAFIDQNNSVQFADFPKPDDSNNSSYYSAVQEKTGYTPRVFPLLAGESSRRMAGYRTEDLDGAFGGDWNNSQKFFYERPTSDNNHLFVIIRGSYAGHSDTYYKLDIGRNDDSGIFSYYHLVRNIDYHIVINSVNGDGYATAAEAAAGPAFNNFSAAVETRDLLNVSNGEEMLYVNFTSKVIVEPGQEIVFRWCYLSDLKDNNSSLGYGSGPNVVNWNNDVLGLKVGEVVKDISGPNPVTIDGKTWYEVKIKVTDELTTTTKTQTFTIYKPGGLSRTITLIARQKWELDNVETYPGIWEDDTQHPAWDPDEDWTTDDNLRYVGPEQNAPLTLFFDLPAALPKAMFPLEFIIESDRQNIENDKQGSAPVLSGPSLFEDANGQQRNQYVKVVQWEDYYDTENDMYRASGQVVRVRFRTITAISALAGITERTTTLRIRNDYFVDADDSFVRNQNTTVPDPSPSTWDFSSANWSTIMSELNGNPVSEVQGVDGMTITPGAGATIQTGETEDGLDYFITSSRNTTFSFTMTNDTSAASIMTVFVTASNENDSADGDTVDAVVTITDNNIDADTAPNNSGFTVRSANAWVSTAVVGAKSSVTVNVRPAQDAPMRFYRIGYITGQGDAASDSATQQP